MDRARHVPTEEGALSNDGADELRCILFVLHLREVQRASVALSLTVRFLAAWLELHKSFLHVEIGGHLILGQN